MLHFAGHKTIQVSLLLSNKPDAYALQRAKKYGVTTYVFNRAEFTGTDQVLHVLQEAHIDFILLAGFLWLVPPYLLKAYPNAILNIHPALLPKFGGKGMHGHYVHKAVKEAGQLVSGISIHLVNEEYDRGDIVFQAETPLLPTDTPEDIAAKVLALEHLHYGKTAEKYINEHFIRP